MEQMDFAQQTVTLAKMGFDNTFKAISMVQDQAQKLSGKLLDQAQWVPNEGKQIFNEWGDSFKVHRGIYKRSVDEGFTQMDEFIHRPG